MTGSGETLTITANKRLARNLLAEANGRAEAAGARAWRRPAIFPLSGWLRGRYDELLLEGHERRALLSPLAETLLWERIVRDQQSASTASPLLDVPGAARALQGAWRLLHAYVVPLTQLAQHHDTAELQLLARCCGAFTSHCDDALLWDEGRLLQRVTTALRREELACPARVVLFGFHELLPAHDELIRALQARGGVVERRSAPLATQPLVRRTVLDDRALEIRAAVRWAVRRLTAAPTERVAIVAPRLTDDRVALLRELEEALEPESLWPGRRARRTLFNISLGEPLSKAPLVHDASRWWRLAAGAALPLEELLSLLRSPFCAHAETEREARALFGLALRQHRKPELDIEGLRSRIASPSREGAAAAPPLFVAAFADFSRQAHDLRDLRQPAARWRPALRALLKAIGWPGERALDSDEYQQMERLGEELDQLAALDLVHPAGFDLHTLLSWLQRALDGALFQPEAAGDAPLQVLGQLEAVGQRFDRLWLLGLDEAHWPTPAEPNPFLPLALLRQHRMPHASAQLELERAQRLTSELLRSAGEVVVSTPRRDGDVACIPSALIAALPEVDASTLDVDLGQRVAATLVEGAWESCADGRAPALRLPAQLRGGSAIFADQAACPFRAFARRRLGAEPREQPVYGLDALTLGTLVHRALELVWKAIAAHARLLALDDRQREAVIASAVDGALAEARQGREDLFAPRMTALVRARTIALLCEWLAIEAERAPFVVVAREERVQLDVDGVGCTVQVDRIDQLDDGTQVILDYKTGKRATSAPWLLPRLQEPQLPLYTLAADRTLGAVALAKVRRDAARGFDGLWREEATFPPAFSSKRDKLRGEETPLGFDERLARWREQLRGLAAELAAGEATVTPSTDACRDCGLDALCRHRELKGIDLDADDEEASA